MLQLLRYHLIRIFNVGVFHVLKTSATNKPVSYHRHLFNHYMIILPMDITLIADKAVVRKVMKITFPYFKMCPAHENIFMDEFYFFLTNNRKDLYHKLYKVNTNLSDTVINERVKTLDLIYQNYAGLEVLNHLTDFFSQDYELPHQCQAELRGSILSVLAVSISVGWGCD